MKTIQELFNEEYIPAHAVEKELWDGLTVPQRSKLVLLHTVLRFGKGMKGEVYIYEGINHIVFFVR